MPSIFYRKYSLIKDYFTKNGDKTLNVPPNLQSKVASFDIKGSK